MQLLNADLHCHSFHSDGELAPAELARRACSAGVQLWSLTDHDTLSGQADAQSAAKTLGMAYVTGVEISVTFLHETVHILGLDVDANQPALVQSLAEMRAGRVTRAQAMAESLAKVGIHGAYEGALRHVGDPIQLSRTHFARFLVERGFCSNTHEVFTRFLKEGKPGYVPHEWAKLGEAMRWIREAGGVAVLAHPARYRFTPNEEYALFTEFKGHGGVGVEVTCGAHFPEETLRYAQAAREYGLLASRGSDFHAPGESRVNLGELPDLPADTTPVWSLWQSRLAHLPAPGWAEAY